MTARPSNLFQPKRWFFRTSLGLLLGLFLACSVSAVAEVYYYRDAKGGWHFTDAPTDTRFRPFKVQAGIRAGAGGNRIEPALLQPYIDAAAGRYRLDPDLVKAVIRAESAFDPQAVSWAGAQGLMQLMPETAALMGVANAFSIKENIYGGSRYLRHLLDRFGGNLPLAIAAYNCGPDRVAAAGEIPDIQETRTYVKRVLQYYGKHNRP